MAIGAAHTASYPYVWVIVAVVVFNLAWWGRRLGPTLLNSATARRGLAESAAVTAAIVIGLLATLFGLGQLLGLLGYRALFGSGAATFVLGLGVLALGGIRRLTQGRAGRGARR